MDYTGLGADPVMMPVPLQNLSTARRVNPVSYTATAIPAMMVEGRSAPVYNQNRPFSSTVESRLKHLNVALKRDLISGQASQATREITYYAAHEEGPRLNTVARFLVQQLTSTSQGQQILRQLLMG